MEVEVRGATPEENEQLKKLCEDMFKDLGLGKKLKKVLIISDMGMPAFYVACKFKKDVQPIYLKDIARIREQATFKRLQITEERYYDQVISILGEKFGNENIIQDERNIIKVKGSTASVENIKIYDFTEEVRERIIDALWHILPEGFKVRQFKHFSDGFIVMATDIPPIQEFTNQIESMKQEFWGEEDV